MVGESLYIIKLCISCNISAHYIFFDAIQGIFQQFWEKAPGQKWEKMVNLTSKLGEINDIDHNRS